MRKIRTVAVLPTLFTLGNLVCGFFAIVVAARVDRPETPETPKAAAIGTLDPLKAAKVWSKEDPVHNCMLSGWLIFLAMIFDALDGHVARLAKTTSDFGAQLDSLCDVVTFGVAPAFLLVKMCPHFEYMHHNMIWIIAALYAACAAMRLARFNVITNPLLRPGTKDSSRDFVGLPVPAAASTVAATVLFLLKLAETDRSLKSWALLLPPLMLLVAFLMVSTVRYPSGKNVDMQTQTRLRPFIFFLCCIGLVIFYKEVAVLGICLAYIFFGLIRYVRRGRPGLAPKS